MNILITGGLGYIGSHTIAALYEKGHNCVIIDNCSNSKKSVHQTLISLTKKNIPFYKADINNEKVLDKIFQENEIEAVIHFAALKAVGESCDDPFLYYQNNIQGTINLLKAMTKNNIKQLIFSSSATVYDANKKHAPYHESDPVGNCTSPYGTTKILMEQAIRDCCLHQGLKAIVLRYFNPLGAHPSGLLGEDPNGIPANLFPYLFKVATKELPTLQVFGGNRETRDGTGERDYIDIQDLAHGHIAALEFLQKKNKSDTIDKSDKSKNYNIFNLGTGKGTTVKEAIQLVEKTLSITIPYQIKERRPGDIAVSTADPTKAKQQLSRETRRSLEESIQNTRNFLKKKEEES